MSPPKRGAPLGNTNAIKHGFYSRQLKKARLSGDDPSNLIDLKEEIFLLRLFIRHLLDLGLQTKGYQEGIHILRTLSLGVSSLSRLIRIQHWISPIEDEKSQAIQEALKRVHEQWNITEDF